MSTTTALPERLLRRALRALEDRLILRGTLTSFEHALLTDLRNAHETSCAGSGDPANCPENEGRGCCMQNPVAWRWMVDSAFEPHPRYIYADNAPVNSRIKAEPLYARPALKTAAEGA